jgi:hypothetical protein
MVTERIKGKGSFGVHYVIPLLTVHVHRVLSPARCVTSAGVFSSFPILHLRWTQQMRDRPSFDRNYWTVSDISRVISHDVIEFSRIHGVRLCPQNVPTTDLQRRDATSDSRVSHAFKDPSSHCDEDIANKTAACICFN